MEKYVKNLRDDNVLSWHVNSFGSHLSFPSLSSKPLYLRLEWNLFPFFFIFLGSKVLCNWKKCNVNFQMCILVVARCRLPWIGQSSMLFWRHFKGFFLDFRALCLLWLCHQIFYLKGKIDEIQSWISSKQ